MHAACEIIIVRARMTVLCNVKSGHDMGCGVVNACRVNHYWAGRAFVRCVTSLAHVFNITNSLRGNPRSIADLLVPAVQGGTAGYSTDSLDK